MSYVSAYVALITFYFPMDGKVLIYAMKIMFSIILAISLHTH